MRTFFIHDLKEIEDIFNSVDHCFVGLSDEEGYPYVFPMNFAYVENKIILHSGPHGTHLKNLERDNRACIALSTEGNPIMYQHEDVACSYSVDAKSIICKGRIEFVEDFDEKYRLINLFMKRYTDRTYQISAPAINNLKVWTMEPEEITAKAFGQNYRYTDNRIERK